MKYQIEVITERHIIIDYAYFKREIDATVQDIKDAVSFNGENVKEIRILEVAA